MPALISMQHVHKMNNSGRRSENQGFHLSRYVGLSSQNSLILELARRAAIELHPNNRERAQHDAWPLIGLV
eukprot:4283004-Pleurochrysis_carterae.AAC.1